MSVLAFQRVEPTDQVVAFVKECGLPVEDLRDGFAGDLFVCAQDEQMLGVAGVESSEGVGLLRSVAVCDRSRGQGIGKLLVAHVENFARKNGISELYLLTTTAEAFFEKLGYKNHDRDQAPDFIRGTREFSSLCPDSAVFMVKNLFPSRSAPVSRGVE